MVTKLPLQDLLSDISGCTLCEPHLPLGPRPVVRASATAQLLIIGQAPGTKVHASGIPWDDASGKRLRQWLDVTPEQFYDERVTAIMPMGFCYPGKGKSGDLPPRPECAPAWHAALLAQMPNVKLTLLVGGYAQDHYLGKHSGTLAQRVRDYALRDGPFVPLPHPSPRNTLWLRRNPWFEEEVVPLLRRRTRRFFTS